MVVVNVEIEFLNVLLDLSQLDSFLPDIFSGLHLRFFPIEFILRKTPKFAHVPRGVPEFVVSFHSFKTVLV